MWGMDCIQVAQDGVQRRTVVNRVDTGGGGG